MSKFGPPNSVSPEKARQLVIQYGGIKPASRNSPYTYGSLQRAYHSFMSEERRHKVYVFSDTHVCPSVPNDHLFWLAKWIKEGNPDFVICNGDFADFNSLNGHDGNETVKGRLKPSIKADLEHLDVCMGIITNETQRWDIIFCSGNHENKRITRFENNNPEMHEFIMDSYLGILKKHKWHYVPFGRYYNLQGVDFTHAPLNDLGKPAGGKTALRNVAMYSVRDVVFSHTHKHGLVREGKYGMNEWTTVVNTGCSMPPGYIQEYAIDGMSGAWSHGVVELSLQFGKIQDCNFISMDTLRERYGKSN
jgi:predicted phosphodiesterase